MLTAQLNDMLCRVGPGTPMGDVMRRYWLPVSLSDDVVVNGKPKQVRILGEDLVLFRDDRGRPGLLELRCSHRLTSLAYGRVEDGGIRCSFHGWLYDIDGRCKEQPGEPEWSSFKDKVQHPAYPCQDSGGLIFAYMGPRDTVPPLPPFEVLAREDGSRQTDFYPINSNYLQNVEGALDPIHSSFLHQDHWSSAKHVLAELPKVEVQLEETDFGIWRRSVSHGPDKDDLVPAFGHFIMPSGFMGIRNDRRKKLWQKFQSWYVPVDDEHTLRFVVGFTPLSVTDGISYDYGIKKDQFIQPGPANDYFRDYDNVDTISGIPLRPVTEKGSVKGLLAQDSMANETQGPIANRTREHLGVGDRIVILTRKLLQRAVEDVQQGRPPQFSTPAPTAEGWVRVNGTDDNETF